MKYLQICIDLFCVISNFSTSLDYGKEKEMEMIPNVHKMSQRLRIIGKC